MAEKCPATRTLDTWLRGNARHAGRLSAHVLDCSPCRRYVGEHLLTGQADPPGLDEERQRRYPLVRWPLLQGG